MTARKGLYLNFWIDGYALTSDSTNVEAGISYDEIEAGAYASAGKSYLMGRGEGMIAFNGFFNKDTAGSHNALKTLGTAKTAGVAWGNNAVPTIGDIAAGMPVNQFGYQVNSDLDGLIAAAAELKSTGTALEWGTLLANSTDLAATDSLDSHDNGASSANGAAAYLFLSGVTASDTIEVKIEDSTDDSSYSDLATFTLDGSAIGGERITVAGTVNRYTRVTATVTDGSGSPAFDFAVILCRN